MIKKGFFILLCSFSILYSKQSIILKKNIFTAPLPPPSPPKIETTSILKPAPLPTLDTLIEISGIAYFSSGCSFVIIKDKKTNIENIYKEGEKVGESKIIKILKDKVVFEYDGKSISLNLENKSSSASLVISKEEGSKVTISPKLPEAPKVPEELFSFDVDFNNTISALITDRKLMENLSVTPNVIEGKVEGFKVSNLPEDSLPYKYGLRNGDIVKRVNGVIIDSINTAFKVYNQIRNSNTQIVTVEILRDNKPILLTYRINR